MPMTVPLRSLAAATLCLLGTGCITPVREGADPQDAFVVDGAPIDVPPARVVLALDFSGSMHEQYGDAGVQRYEALQRGVEVVSRVDGVAFGAVAFDDEILGHTDRVAYARVAGSPESVGLEMTAIVAEERCRMGPLAPTPGPDDRLEVLLADAEGVEIILPSDSGAAAPAFTRDADFVQLNQAACARLMAGGAVQIRSFGLPPED